MVQKIIQHPFARQKRSDPVLLFSETVIRRIPVWKLDHSSS